MTERYDRFARRDPHPELPWAEDEAEEHAAVRDFAVVAACLLAILLVVVWCD